MSDLHIPDFNEFHPMESYTGPCILRSGYSTTHIDAYYATDVPRARVQPWWGVYHYLARFDDPPSAAHFMHSIIGPDTPNLLILDLEEGDGDQRARRDHFIAALARVRPGSTIWVYSGLDYALNHLNGEVDWVAAYQPNEPTIAHHLWQNTDRATFPGLSSPCDASIFHGTVTDLIALTSPPTPPPSITQGKKSMEPVLRADGSTDIFVIGRDSALYSLRCNPDGTPHTNPDGTPAWRGLGGVIGSPKPAT